MTFSDVEKLYALLPAVYRTRDAGEGYPLKQFLQAIAEQVAVLEGGLDQLYENHFVETAAPWALAYLGDLLGISALPSGGLAQSPRAEIGHTLAYRRGKGTVAMLEQMARDITGWPARAQEFYQKLACTQQLNHLRPQCQTFVSLRRAEGLQFVGTAFETAMRSVEVRRMEPGLGKWNIANVAIFLWRMAAYSRTDAPLIPVTLSDTDPLAGRRYRIHPFGLDTQLFTLPVTEDDGSHLADPINVALPLGRRMLADASPNFAPSPSLYGADRSLSLTIAQTISSNGYTRRQSQQLPASSIVVCDLSDVGTGPVTAWNHEGRATEGMVALDPVLGRVVIGSIPEMNRELRVTYHYGFSSDLGGGEYRRSVTFPANTQTRVRVPPVQDVAQPGFENLTSAIGSLSSTGGAIELFGSGRYVETLPRITANGSSWMIAAADGSCPAIWLRPQPDGQPDGQSWTLDGDRQGQIVLDGLWLAGQLRAVGQLSRLTLRHCTIAPGLGIDSAGNVVVDPLAAIEIASTSTSFSAENCILPPLRVAGDVKLHLKNCIIDAGDRNQFAISNLSHNGPAGTLHLENCTILGKVACDQLDLASNCIFWSGSVVVQRRQTGCVRFSWLPIDSQSRTPRRYRCQPTQAGMSPPIEPHFKSLRYGDAAYAQLSRHCHEAIRTGADDGAEMGAFHDLYQPQRESHLRARLAEYLRFGLEAGVWFET